MKPLLTLVIAISMQVSVFSDVYSQKPYNLEIEQVINRIKKTKHAELISRIRTEKDSDKRATLKKKLPVILFSGVFTAQNNNSLLEHSGLIVLDFDHISTFDATWKRLTGWKHCYLAFKSPSGDGIKMVVKIPANKDTHIQSAEALREIWKNETSFQHFQDVCRRCFESWDENLYHNPDAPVFTDLYTKPAIAHKPQGFITEQDAVYAKLRKWLESTRMDTYTKGNRQNFLVKLSAACNRFGIDMYTVQQNLKNDYLYQYSDVPSEDFDAIVERVYKTYRHQYNVSYFDNAYTAISKQQETKGEVIEQEEVFSADMRAIDVIYLDDVKDSMLYGFRNGYNKGTTTYFPSIDKHWKWRRGEITVLHGHANNGKTTFMLQLCLVKSVYEGTKWGIFSPEQDPPDDFYNDLIHAYVGKSPIKGYANQMTEQEYVRAMEFVKDHFFYINPMMATKNAPTPEYIDQRFLELQNKHGIEGCIIDPFNQLDNDWRKHGNRDDHYLANFLSERSQFSKRNNCYYIIIAHPKGEGYEIIKKGEYEGNYRIPRSDDLSGGAMWGNKCDNVLCYHRPTFVTDPESPLSLFISQKIKKPRLVGKRGTAALSFDYGKNRFYDIETGYNPLVSFDKPVEEPPKVEVDSRRLMESFEQSYTMSDTSEEPPF